MTINFSKTSQKQISKLDTRIKAQLKKRLFLFMDSPNSPELRKHKLSGDYSGYWSINITGDYRLIYREITSDHIYVITLGTHSQLYG